MRKLLVLGLLLIMGCPAHNPHDYGVVPEDRDVTLLIVNKGVDPARVYDGSGMKLATVYAGKSECVTLRYANTVQRLRVGYLAYNRDYYSPEFAPIAHSGWYVEVDSKLASSTLYSLQPAERCK